MPMEDLYFTFRKYGNHEGKEVYKYIFSTIEGKPRRKITRTEWYFRKHYVATLDLHTRRFIDFDRNFTKIGAK